MIRVILAIIGIVLIFLAVYSMFAQIFAHRIMPRICKKNGEFRKSECRNIACKYARTCENNTVFVK